MILAVQSIKIKPYADSILGFENTCNFPIKKLFISGLTDLEIERKIHKINPDLILAIGRDALIKVKNIKSKPIVYIMVLNPQSILSTNKNITGISMNITYEKQLVEFADSLPNIKRIGLLFDPERTNFPIKKVQSTAKKLGLELIIKEVNKLAEVPSLIKSVGQKIDAFWMLPDKTVISAQSIEFMLLFSLENNIPLLSFSAKYVEMGALLSLDIVPFDIGKQAGETAKKILSGYDIKDIPKMEPREIVLTINLKIAKKLGINFSDKIIKKAKIIP